MPDTITVVAVPPVSDISLGSGYSAVSMSAGNRISAGPTYLQMAYPYYDSPQLAIDCAKFMSDYLDSHNANDPNTLSVIAKNIGHFCWADSRLVSKPNLQVLDAFGGPKAYNYSTMNIPQLSGDVTTPITAWAHFLWGNGAPRTVNLASVGLRIQPNQIDPVMNFVNSGAVGTFSINERFSRDTTLDGIIPAAYLGHVTLKTEGTLTIASSGAWFYDGVVRAYNDVYDANPSDFRGPLGEWSTKVLRHFSGTPYEISMPGEIAVKGNGFR